MNTGCTKREFRGRFVLKTHHEDVDAMQRKLLDALEHLGYSETDCFAVRLAFEEALINAATHGNQNDPEKHLIVICDATADRITIELEDEGEGFDPAVVPDPTADENLEIPAGRGLTLIRAYMSDVEVIPPGNRIRMTYKR